MNKMNAVLEKLDQHIVRVGRKVTNKPVYLRVSSRMKDPTEGARMMRYIGPRQNEIAFYEIVFNETYLEKNQNNLRKLKAVACHELAHIPHKKGMRWHGTEFRTECKRLCGVVGRVK